MRCSSALRPRTSATRKLSTLSLISPEERRRYELEVTANILRNRSVTVERNPERESLFLVKKIGAREILDSDHDAVLDVLRRGFAARPHAFWQDCLARLPSCTTAIFGV
jgi:hypothetical protein